MTTKRSSCRRRASSLRKTLYRTEDGYPTESDKAFRRTSSKLIGKRAKCVFKELRPERYAVAGFHDEDNDGEMAANFLGIPQEGTLASNDAEGG